MSELEKDQEPDELDELMSEIEDEKAVESMMAEIDSPDKELDAVLSELDTSKEDDTIASVIKLSRKIADRGNSDLAQALVAAVL